MILKKYPSPSDTENANAVISLKHRRTDEASVLILINESKSLAAANTERIGCYSFAM